MNGTLIIMGYIYNPDGFDWMNFKLTKENPATFHHIKEKRDGGKKTIENGAILSSFAHQLLNILDLFCPDAYNDLQNVFIKINGSGEPPTIEIMQEIDDILQKLFCTEEYQFRVDMNDAKHRNSAINLKRFRKYYLESRKELVKCLK